MNTPISKIDITPLVGVALILVIVFMVTSPLMVSSPDLDIDLPKAKTIETKSQTNITISISKENAIALNDKQVNFSILQSELSKMITKHPDRLVIIRADKKVKHDKILRLLNVAKKAGATHLALATLQRNRRKD